MRKLKALGARLSWLPLLAVLVGLVIGVGGGFAVAATVNCPGGPCYGTTSADSIYGIKFGDEIFAYAGQDQAYGREGPDTVRGGDDGDLVEGNPGSDLVEGNAGNDSPLIVSGAGIYGGANGDTIYGYQGEDWLIGGNDLVDDYMDAGVHNDYLTSNEGYQDFVEGGQGYDVCFVDKQDVWAGCEAV